MSRTDTAVRVIGLVPSDGGSDPSTTTARTCRPHQLAQDHDRAGHQVALAAERRGAIIRTLGDVIVLMPPIAIAEADVQLLVVITAAAISEVTSARLSRAPKIPDQQSALVVDPSKQVFAPTLWTLKDPPLP